MTTNNFDSMESMGVAKHTALALMNGLWPRYKSLEVSVAYVDTTNANGDFNGTGNPSTIFTVTGIVEVALIALCTVNFAGASATIEIGTAKNTAGLIAQTTATDIDADEIWHDASPDASVEASTVILRKIVNQDIIATVGTADITAGTIKYILFWNPISSDGNVTIA